jgi:hypothetical protein
MEQLDKVNKATRGLSAFCRVSARPRRALSSVVAVPK